MPCTAFTPSTDKVALIDSLISNHFLRFAVSATLKNSYILGLEHLRADQVPAADFKQIQKVPTFLIPAYQPSREVHPENADATEFLSPLAENRKSSETLPTYDSAALFLYRKAPPKDASHF